jgi:transcriptional regulator with XRE-family HTH domain
MVQAREFTVGERIAYFRGRAGLSQRVLAELVSRTENWLYRVEANKLPVDSVRMYLALASALKVDLADLTGGFMRGDSQSGPLDEHPEVPIVRRALTLPTSLLAGAGDATDPAEFCAAVAAARSVYDTKRMRYSEVGAQIPVLLQNGYATLRAAQNDSDHLEAVRGLVSAYSLMEVWLRRVGEFDLARQAADRAMVLADDTGDPEFRAAAAWKVACTLTSSGLVQDSLELMQRMIAECEPGDEARPGHLAAYGALHLQGAVAAVRANKAPVGWDLLRRAGRVADRMGGSEANLWNTCFGPTNVAMHSVHLAAEEGNAEDALRYADSVTVGDEQPLERKTRYWLEVVNCNRIVGDDYGTVHMLDRVKKLSPEEIVYSPLARQAVLDLLGREKPTWGPDLRGIARHMGIVE